MSKYTTEVRFICESAAGLTNSTGYDGINNVIAKAIPNVFSFNFPIFDETYRSVLCGKILKHYYTREICEETVGLWKLRLDTRMNEIMPFYNKLYKSELLEFNPLYDVDITREGKKENSATDNDTTQSTRTGTGNSETDATSKTTNTNTSSETSRGTNDSENETTVVATNEGTNKTTNNSTTSAESKDNKTERDMYSDTPQGSLNNVDNETYLTNARKKTGIGTKTDTGSSSGTTDVEVSSEDNSTTTSSDTTTTTSSLDVSANGESNQEGNTTTSFRNNDTFNSNQIKNAESTEDYLERVSGKQGGASYSKLLMEYRETFLNIDMQVIESLSDLFFGLW